MLCDDVLAYQTNAESMVDIEPIKPRIRTAQKFILSPEFAQVAEALAVDYTGLVRVFEHCRLPYPEIWLEVAQNDRPRFSHSDVQLPVVQKRPRRIGYLLTATREDLSAWKAHLFWNFQNAAGCNAAMAAVIFDMIYPVQNIDHVDDEEVERARDKALFFPRDKPVPPHPGWAHSDDRTKLAMLNHVKVTEPDYPWISPGSLLVTEGHWDAWAKMVREMCRSDWAGETGYVLAMVGLLNTRNAVEIERVDQVKLNKVRIKNGKLPLLEHKLLKIHHRVVRRVYNGAGRGDYAPMRGHFVMGHWKVRKTGIFFWHPFKRGDFSRGRVEKDYQL